jgi:hypothetical protein
LTREQVVTRHQVSSLFGCKLSRRLRSTATGVGDSEIVCLRGCRQTEGQERSQQ